MMETEVQISYEDRRRIRQQLNDLSHNNIVAMLNTCLIKIEKKRLASNYVSALRCLSNMYKTTKKNERFKYAVALQQANMSYREAKSLGFGISNRLWTRCRNDRTMRANSGRFPIAEDLVHSINEHMESISSQASNRTVCSAIDNQPIGVWYCSMSFRKAYQTFAYREELRYSTFFKYVQKKFKKPHRKTDICEYCDSGSKLKQIIIDHLKTRIDSNVIEDLAKLDYDIENSSNDKEKQVENFLRFLTNLKIGSKEIRDHLFNLKQVYFHKRIANDQRYVFNQMRNDKDLLRDSIIIIMDYKQSILLDQGPIQLNAEFYSSKKSVGLLGNFKAYFISYVLYFLSYCTKTRLI
jgi:hypothetical protein